jgi:hypothetical protein
VIKHLIIAAERFHAEQAFLEGQRLLAARRQAELERQMAVASAHTSFDSCHKKIIKLQGEVTYLRDEVAKLRLALRTDMSK